MAKHKFLSPVEFTRLVFGRLLKYWYFVAGLAVILGVLFFLYALNAPATYTSSATIFSSSGSSDNSAANSAISMLLGGEGSKSFSEETSINIIELAQSRAINEAVASVTVPSMGNKTIAELFLNDMNVHKGLLQKRIKVPESKEYLVIVGAIYLKSGLAATINKNNSFVLNFTGRDPDLVKAISYAYIDKISQYYIESKREKAKSDYAFATGKVDSLQKVMGTKDNTLIAMDKRTLFTNTDKLEYRVPAENLAEDKQMIRAQYSQAIINQQSAAYKLQKETPLIQVLDKPDPPYEQTNKSTLLYAILGLIGGSVIAGTIITGKLFLRYTRQELSRALFGVSPKGADDNSAAPAS